MQFFFPGEKMYLILLQNQSDRVVIALFKSFLFVFVQWERLHWSPGSCTTASTTPTKWDLTPPLLTLIIIDYA